VCCSVLQCVAVCCSVLQCVAVCCSVLQCVVVCCSVLQCIAVCCSVLQCVYLTAAVHSVRIFIDTLGTCREIHKPERHACCSMLQRVAACCSVLQRVAACGSTRTAVLHSAHILSTHLGRVARFMCANDILDADSM